MQTEGGYGMKLAIAYLLLCLGATLIYIVARWGRHK